MVLESDSSFSGLVAAEVKDFLLVGVRKKLATCGDLPLWIGGDDDVSMKS